MRILCKATRLFTLFPILLSLFITFAVSQDSPEEGEAQHAPLLTDLTLPASGDFSDSHLTNRQGEDAASNPLEAERFETKDWLSILQAARAELAWDAAVRNLSAAIEKYHSILTMIQEWEVAAGEIQQTGGVGHTILAQGVYELAALTLSGIADEIQLKNISLGLSLLTLASQHGSIEAELALSHRYFHGQDLPQDCELAFRHGYTAAQQYRDVVELSGAVDTPTQASLLRDRWAYADYSPPDIHYTAKAYDDLAGESFDGLNDLTMLDLFRDRGDERQFELLTGAQPIRPGNEIEDLTGLVHQGNAAAIFKLAFAHLRGIGVIQNSTAAYSLFLQAQALGVASASNALGVMNHNGDGTLQNLSMAIKHFQRGAALRDPDSQFNLGALYMSAGNSSQYEEGFQLLHQAYDNGHWQAPLQLALAHKNGLGTNESCDQGMPYLNEFLMEQAPWHKDIQKAVKAYDKGDEWKALVSFLFAAEQGSSAAQDNAAFLLIHSKYLQLPNRYELAFEMYCRASKQVPSALTQAAHLLWEGLAHHLPQGSDRLRAIHLYEQAGKQNESEALFFLAQAHQHGHVVAKNLTQAEDHYKQAIATARYSRHAVPHILALFGLSLCKLELQLLHIFKLVQDEAQIVLNRENALLLTLASLLLSVLWLKHLLRRHRQGNHLQMHS